MGILPRRSSLGCHTATLHRVAHRVLRNKEDAEDAVQDSLCKACANLQSFQGRASFSTSSTRIVINSALMVRRRRWYVPNLVGRDSVRATRTIAARSCRCSSRSRTICSGTRNPRSTLERQLPQLPTLLRAAFRLRELDGLSASVSCRVLRHSQERRSGPQSMGWTEGWAGTAKIAGRQTRDPKRSTSSSFVHDLARWDG